MRLWSLIGLSVLLLAGILAGMLGNRRARQANVTFHSSLPRMLELNSVLFKNEDALPSILSCEGEGGSPPLQWANAPAGTRSFVLIVVDPDLPSPGTRWMEFVHWVVYDLPAETYGLPSQLSSRGLAQLGAVAGRNGYRGREYVAPCPVSGRHRYVYRLYALDVAALEPKIESKRGVLAAMQGHVLAYGELWGHYECRTLSFWGAMRRNMRPEK